MSDSRVTKNGGLKGKDLIDFINSNKLEDEPVYVCSGMSINVATSVSMNDYDDGDIRIR